MEPILSINSSFRGYSMCLRNENENENEIIFSTHYTFKPYKKSEELPKSSLENTMQLIKCAQDNGINSFGVEIRGPLHISPLNTKLLYANGIDITYIKDNTPIPHNGVHIQKREKAKIKTPNN